jgi:IS5 family transposase
MKPEKKQYEAQGELFKVELTRLVAPGHVLVRLADKIDWESFDKKFEKHYREEGRPGVETRLMVSLHYLKYLEDLSDEETVKKWTENPYWQYLSGRQYFEHELPIDSSSMTRWRHRIGEEGAEELLKQTIQTGIRAGYVKRTDCVRVNVDTTVQPKNVRFPTDARLYDRMRERLVKQARAEGISLRQSYDRVGKQCLRRQQNYSHARQPGRSKRETKKLKTLLGRVIRDIERKAVAAGSLARMLTLAKRLCEQEKDSKNKIYSIHEPQVQCIAKGKVHKKYEFGNKAGYVTSARGNWILGAIGFTSNAYDGHTLGINLNQAEKMTGIEIAQAVVDKGYRGHNLAGRNVLIVPRKKKHASRSIQKWWKRRSAIEPIIGHQKSEHRLDCNRLYHDIGDQLNPILSACGFNFKKLMRAFFAYIRFRVQDGYELNLLVSVA